MSMEHTSDISDSTYRILIDRYQQALNALKDTKQLSLAEVLEVLLARDAIQAVSPKYRPPAQVLLTLQTLDQQLADYQSLIETYTVAISPWKEKLAIDSAAWWWPTPIKRKRPWWSQQDWLWSMGSLIFLSVSASLVLNTAARFWSGGIASAGTLPIVVQSILTLIAGKGALTDSGHEAWQTFLKKQGISEAYWHEWSFGAAGVVFVCVATIHGSLPWVATWYNDRGWQHYHVENGEPRQLESALQSYQTALSLRPDFPEAKFNIGLIYEDLQQYKQAKENYQFVVESNSEDVPLDVWLSAHNNLARLLLLEGNNRDAAPLLIRAQQSVDADLSETNADIADVNYNLLKNLGWVRFNQQRYNEARTRLEEAIRFDQDVLQTVSFQENLPADRAAAHCLLAQVADAQGQTAPASEAWEQCLLRADSGNPDDDAWVGVYERRELEASGND